MKKEAGKRLKRMSTGRSSSDRNKMMMNKVMMEDAISNFKKVKVMKVKKSQKCPTIRLIFN